MKDEKKKYILGVCINNTYKKIEKVKDEKLREKKLKEITTGSWRINKEKIKNIKYIVGFYHKEIKSIYKVKENNLYEEINTRNKENGKIEKRYRFNVYDENEIYYKNSKIMKDLNNRPLYGPIRYFDIKD